ncbi:hypothetical protein Droror1_Dr00008877, partial [Drosera rotundifolia]
MTLKKFILTVVGVGEVILLARSDIEQSVAIFRRNVRQIRSWIEEESVAASKSTRESTPCSLIRNPDSIHTPGSTSRLVGVAEAIRRSEGSMRRRIPTTQEIEEFFVVLEKEQQKQLIEKYNFDPVNDMPLTGRFECE